MKKYLSIILIMSFFSTSLNAGFITRSVGGFALKTGYKYAKKKSAEYGKKRFMESNYGNSFKNKVGSLKNSYYGKKVISKYSSSKQTITKKIDKGAGVIAKKYNVEKKDVYSAADTTRLTTKMLYKAKKRDLDIDDYQEIYFNLNPKIIKARSASIKNFWNASLNQF